MKQIHAHFAGPKTRHVPDTATDGLPRNSQTPPGTTTTQSGPFSAVRPGSPRRVVIGQRPRTCSVSLTEGLDAAINHKTHTGWVYPISWTQWMMMGSRGLVQK